MEFEWNENKGEYCFRNRGFDFNYVARVFSDRHKIIKQDLHRDYGEDRYQVLGMIEERVFCCLDDARTHISNDFCSQGQR